MIAPANTATPGAGAVTARAALVTMSLVTSMVQLMTPRTEWLQVEESLASIAETSRFRCGPGHVGPPPLTNVVPVASATNIDPHEDVRNTPAARVQKSDFLAPGGTIVDVCGGQPCRNFDYTP